MNGQNNISLFWCSCVSCYYFTVCTNFGCCRWSDNKLIKLSLIRMTCSLTSTFIPRFIGDSCESVLSVTSTFPRCQIHLILISSCLLRFNESLIFKNALLLCHSAFETMFPKALLIAHSPPPHCSWPGDFQARLKLLTPHHNHPPLFTLQGPVPFPLIIWDSANYDAWSESNHQSTCLT